MNYPLVVQVFIRISTGLKAQEQNFLTGLKSREATLCLE